MWLEGGAGGRAESLNRCFASWISFFLIASRNLDCKRTSSSCSFSIWAASKSDRSSFFTFRTVGHFLDPGLVGCSPHQQKSRPNLSIRRGLFDFPNFQFLDPASVSLCRLFESGNEVPLQQERRQPWQDGLPPQGRIRLRIRTLPYRFTTRHRLGYIRSRKYLSSRRYGDSRKAG